MCRARLIGCAAVFLIVSVSRVTSQQVADARSAPARGRLVFAQNCSFCHGADARGGAEGGSDLTRSPFALANDRGARLADFLKVGRPEKKMPPFNLPAGQVADIAAFLRSLATARRADTDGIAAVVVGDPAAGEKYFNGAGGCTACHSVTGDLRRIGARFSPSALQGRIVLPRGTGGYPAFSPEAPPRGYPDVARTVKVTLPSGAIVSGTLLSVTDFHVTLRDGSGTRRTFAREGEIPKVEITDPLQAHIDLMPRLTDKDMHDLTAYLVTLK